MTSLAMEPYGSESEVRKALCSLHSTRVYACAGTHQATFRCTLAGLDLAMFCNVWKKLMLTAVCPVLVILCS